MAVESIVESQLREPASTVGLFYLPCGYLDDGNTLHTEVQLRGTTGIEEDMLASKHVPSDRKMDLLLGACIERVGTITNKERIQALTRSFLLGDRTFLFFAIRRVTHGDIFPFRERCPRESCQHMNTFSYDLGRLQVVEMPDRMRRIYETECPHSKALVRFKCLDGYAEKERDRLVNQMSPVSVELMLRITDINGLPPDQFMVQTMHSADRDHIRAQFAAIDGGVETMIEVRCSACGTLWEMDVNPGQPSFFFPSESQNRWKRRSSISSGA